MRIQSEYLPEFGLAVTWAMCRNPLCENFGNPFEGEIPPGRKRTFDERYTVRTGSAPAGGGAPGTIECRWCGQSARLASNRAVRPIARYFLSLSLPFADCPNEACENHGVNLYEHWPAAGEKQPRYRSLRAHSARCNRCGTSAPPISLGTPRKALDRPETRARWRALIEALPGGPERLGTSHATYYRDLARLSARLGDYHAFRNANLLRPDTAELPVSVCTGVMQVSARLSGPRGRVESLPVIVSVAAVDSANFVVAAHPCFLPGKFVPDAAALEADRGRRPLERRWDALAHPFGDGVDSSLIGPKAALPADTGRDGVPIRKAYAALAHVLVVQKLLSRFRSIHTTLDAADGLAPAALIGYRNRVLARPAGGTSAESGEVPRTAEVVLFSFDRRLGRLKTAPTGRPPAVPETSSPDDAWRAAEAQFAEQPLPARFENTGLDRDDPRVRAALFRQAFKGANSKTGGWAWLHHPARMRGYPNPRMLWLTRTPHKSFARHGRAPLTDASLRPLDAVVNAIRANVRSAGRPVLHAGSLRGIPSRPPVLMHELAVYLLLRNYGFQRRPRLPGAVVPARAMGLADVVKEDPAEIAWRFRLGVEHARRISRWRSA